MKFPDPNIGYLFDYQSKIAEEGILVTFLGGIVRVLFRFTNTERISREVYARGRISWDVIRWGKCPPGTEALRIVLKRGAFRNHLVVFDDLDAAIVELENRSQPLVSFSGSLPDAGMRRAYSVIIEQAKVEDAESLLALQKQAYRSEAELYNDYTIHPLVQSLAEIEKEFADHVVLKAVAGDAIVGSVRAVMRDGTYLIGKLFVHPDFQNQGIGTQLMREIERIHGGAGRFELFTGYRSARNLYLYQKLGYRVFKTEKVSANFERLYLEKTAP